MTPIQMFWATMPFIRIKFIVEFIFVLIKVGICALFIYGFMDMHIENFEWDFEARGRNFIITALVLAFAVYPLLTIIIRRYGMYMVRVAHIAVTARIIKTKKVPKNQVRYGYEQVKKNFLTANVFFVLDKLVHRAVVDLQEFVQSLLGGLGLIAAIAALFKKNLISHIDECCLGITFLRRDVKPFTGAVIGVCTYITAWRAMAKQAVVVTLESIVISIVFFLAGGAWLTFAITSGNMFTIVLSLIVIFSAMAVKKSILNSYIMINMLTIFFQESKKLETMEAVKPIIEKASMLSPNFCNLVYQANETDKFLTDEEQRNILANRRVGIALNQSKNPR